MFGERRLGKKLKGMNKSILTEIENGIWNALEREFNLYKLNLKYETEKNKLKEDIESRKNELYNELRSLENSTPVNRDPELPE